MRIDESTRSSCLLGDITYVKFTKKGYEEIVSAKSRIIYQLAELKISSVYRIESFVWNIRLK